MPVKAWLLASLISVSALASPDFPGLLEGRWRLSTAGTADRELEGRWQGDSLILSGDGEFFRFSRDGMGEHNGLKSQGIRQGEYWLFDFQGTRYTFIGQEHKLAVQVDSHAEGYWKPEATWFLWRR
ncbi:MAG: hypothetical protein U0931_06040 [Vulcanimicrobiota bacterium]